MGKAKEAEVVVPPGRLWPNTPSGAPVKIEVFGATGEIKSGKTLLGLSIAPGVHPPEHEFAGKPRTLILDLEKSSGTYEYGVGDNPADIENNPGVHRIDVPSKLLAEKGSTYKNIDLFKWVLHAIENKLKPRQFDVVMIDPVTDLDSGLVEYVVQNPKQFGLTDNMVARSGAGFKAQGIVWGALREYWKIVLLKIAAACQTFYFTTHLRDEYAGQTRTGRRQPKGKSTLLELSTLYLWLERKPDKDGRIPGPPAALCEEPYGKSRLADIHMGEDGELEITALMPPRIPVCTAKEIRRYIANPPTKLRAAERFQEHGLGEDEKIQIGLATAQATQATEESRLAQLARQAELRQLAQQDAEAVPQNSDKTAELQAAKKKKEEVRAAADDAEAERLEGEVETDLAENRSKGRELMEGNDGEQPLRDYATDEQRNEIKALCGQVAELRSMKPVEVRDLLLKHAKVKVVGDLPVAEANHMIETLKREVKKQKKGQGGPGKN